MFYKRIAFYSNETKDLAIYQIPDRLNDSQVDEYLSSEGFSLGSGYWFEVNNLSTQRKMSNFKFRKLFPNKSLLNEVEAISCYFKGRKDRGALFIQMKTVACKYLYNKGLIMREIKDIIGFSNHTAVVHHINYHKDSAFLTSL